MSSSRETPDVAVLTVEAARAIVRRVQNLFGEADIGGIMQGFTPDAVARFGDFPEMRGRERIETFLRARFARQKHYQLEKHLRTVMGNIIGNDWDARWIDANTGKRRCSAAAWSSGRCPAIRSPCGTLSSTSGKKAAVQAYP